MFEEVASKERRSRNRHCRWWQSCDRRLAAVENCFDLAGRASLVVAGADDAGLGAVTAQMDPFPATPNRDSSTPTVELRIGGQPAKLTELQRPAGDGLVTGSDGSRLRVVACGRSCSVPDPAAESPAVFSFDPGFPIAEIVRPYVKPALQLAMLTAGSAAAVHASAIERDDGAILVAGWSESGKTEAALALLEERGAFLSDKWTVLGADGTASAFPMPVGLRRWLLPHVPRLRRALPARHRLQLRAAGIARTVAHPLRRRGSLPAQAVERAVSLGERVSLRPSELRAAYRHADDPGRRVPLRTLALLTTVPDGAVSVAHAPPAWAAERLAVSAAYERRDWYALADRARYLAGVRGPAAPDEAIAAERELLRQALANATVIEIKAPYPVDPRQLIDALALYL